MVADGDVRSRVRDACVAGALSDWSGVYGRGFVVSSYVSAWRCCAL